MKAFQYLAALGIGAVVTLGEPPLSAQPAPESTEAERVSWGDRAGAMGTLATTLVPQASPNAAAAPMQPSPGIPSPLPGDSQPGIVIPVTQALPSPAPLSAAVRDALAVTALSLGNPEASLAGEAVLAQTAPEAPAPEPPALEAPVPETEIVPRLDIPPDPEASPADRAVPADRDVPVDSDAADPVEQEFLQEGSAPPADGSVPADDPAVAPAEAPETSPTESEPASATSLIDRQPNLLRPNETDEVSITANEALSLEEAIEVARQNNPTITIRQLQLDQSQVAVDEAKAAYAPNFSVNGNFDQSGTLSDTSELYREPEQTLFQNSGDSNSRSAVVSLDGNAQVSYNIIDPDRKARIRAAEIAAEQAEFSLEQELAALRLDVSQAYYALQEADEQVTISEQAVRSAQRSLEDAIALRDAGVGTQFSVLQSEVQLANEQQNLVNGLSTQQKARRQLAQVLSVPEKLNLTAADPVQRSGNWGSTLEESIIQAYINRIELDNQLLQRELSDAQREIVLSATRPSLSAFAQAGPSLAFNFNRTEREDDDVTRSGTRQATLGYQVGLRFQWLFSDGGATRAAARQQELNQAIASENFEVARDTVRREVEDAFYDLAANLRNIDTAEQGVAQADEALRLARLRFQAGVGTQSEIIDAERDLTTARGNRVTAILNYNRALVQMQRAVGESLPAPAYSSPDYTPVSDAG